MNAETRSTHFREVWMLSAVSIGSQDSSGRDRLWGCSNGHSPACRIQPDRAQTQDQSYLSPMTAHQIRSTIELVLESFPCPECVLTCPDHGQDTDLKTQWVDWGMWPQTQKIWLIESNYNILGCLDGDLDPLWLCRFRTLVLIIQRSWGFRRYPLKITLA